MIQAIERCGLLKLITPNAMPLKVLVIESIDLLNDLRSLLPSAEIIVMTQYRDVSTDFVGSNFEWLIGDFNVDLPRDDATFDLIVAEDVLTFAHEPYDTLAALGRLLTDIGRLVTCYENIRYVGVLEQLRIGFYPERRRRLYAKPEIVRLLNDAHFKEIAFTPDEIAAVDIDEWLDFDFDNFSDDLCVKTWLIKADRSTAEAAALKQCFTYEVRHRLARLIHRVEYDIDRKKNLVQLFELCNEYQIFDDYLADFIRSIVTHADTLLIFESAAADRGIELGLSS